ncbi:MAG TPA: hypothetical protein PLL26_02700 [Candidatus Dojkabacteria bacterium]|nr:hypothetical protein [Candidatus Dojkabacteria bacterium]
MRTIQSEFRRIGLVSDSTEPKKQSNFETLLINNVSKSEVSTRCQMIRKGVKEKFKFYNENEHHGTVRTLYKKEGETKMKMSQERYSFLRTLVELLIGQELRTKDIIELMKGVPGGNESTVRNFLTAAKVAVDKFIANSKKGTWTIDSNVSADTFMSMYMGNASKYWKKYYKKPETKQISAAPIEEKVVEEKAVEVKETLKLNDLIDFLKNNKIKFDVNVSINIKFEDR